MKKITFFSIFIIVSSFLFSFYFFDVVPDVMVTHWDINGNPNGFMDKIFGVFLVPMLLVLLYSLFYYIPKIDPKKTNFSQFQKEFDMFILLLLCFLFVIHGIVIAWNLGFLINIGRVMAICIGVLFFYMGILLKKSKINYFIGIRTPWTLSSDFVWKKTHDLGSILFKILGIISCLGFFFPKFLFYVVIFSVIGITIFTMIYSYYVYKQMIKKKS